MEENDDFLQRLKEDNLRLKEENAQVSTAIASSTYQAQEDQNLIQYQIDTAEMLNKIEHFLRGEYIGVDKEGNEKWKTPEDDKLILFNDYGVNSVLSILGNYIDKNTILSFYDEMRINEILGDLGDELANFLYCNYEKMGMDTEFKKTRYQLVVINILHTIESSYRRALGGKTLIDLNSSQIFTQLDNRGGVRQPSTKKKFNLFKPSTW